jgi:hypothetical protein
MIPSWSMFRPVRLLTLSIKLRGANDRPRRHLLRARGVMFSRFWQNVAQSSSQVDASSSRFVLEKNSLWAARLPKSILGTRPLMFRNATRSDSASVAERSEREVKTRARCCNQCNVEEHTTDNRGVVNPDDVQSTEFKSLRAHHKRIYSFTPISANADSNS